MDSPAARDRDSCLNHPSIQHMARAARQAAATQISRSGAAETGTLATLVAEQIGGSARSPWPGL